MRLWKIKEFFYLDQNDPNKLFFSEEDLTSRRRIQTIKNFKNKKQLWKIKEFFYLDQNDPNKLFFSPEELTTRVHIRTIKNISQVIANPKKGDLIVFDIDDTLLWNDINRYKDAPKLIEEDIIKLIAFLRSRGIQVLLLTARSNHNKDETLKELKALQIEFNQIIHAPSKNHQPQKGRFLKEYLDGLKKQPENKVIQTPLEKNINDFGNTPKCVYVFEDNRNQLYDIINTLQHEVQLFCYHFEFPSSNPISIAGSEKKYLFPQNLEEYKLECSLGGGSKSTYKIKNKYNHALVIKHGATPDAWVAEILCNTIYQACGGSIPETMVYNLVPVDLAIALNLKSRFTKFKVSEYLVADQETAGLKEIIRAAIKKKFLLLALLGIIDIKKLHNFIVKNGIVYLLDMGSNFLYRALGENRNENASLITEIETLRDPKYSDWFCDLTGDDLRKQADELKERLDKIEKEIWEVSKTLGISDSQRDQFIEYLTDRLDKILIRYASVLPHAKPDKKGIKDKTGAGVFTYKISNGKVYVLLSKRARHEWWDNFGGKSDDKDKTLLHTAQREVNEESRHTAQPEVNEEFSGQLKFSEYELQNSAFHDLISDEMTYRMYITECSDTVNIKEIKDPEHTEHRWVPLENLLKALETEVIEHEGKATVTIKTGEGDIILYAALYNMLTHPAVWKNLRHLNDKKKCKPTHTQSRFKEIKPNKGHLPITKISTSSEFVKTSLKKSKCVMELKCLFPKITGEFTPEKLLLISKKQQTKELRNNNLETSLPISNFSFFKNSTDRKRKFSQSEIHLKAVLRENYKKNNPKENIQLFLKNHHDLPDEKFKSLADICENLLSEEINHPELLYFYHAVDNVVDFAYDVYTKLYKMIYMDERWRALRLDKGQFKKFPTITEFLLHYGSEFINNNDVGFSDIAISANLFAFGNHLKPTSYSISYVLKNETSRKIYLESLFNNFLRPFNVGKCEIKKLLEIFSHYSDKNGGSLYQIGIELKDVAKYAYPAKSVGAINFWQNEQDLTKIMAILEEEIKKPANPSVINYIISLQARVMMTPTYPFKIKRFNLNKKNLESENRYETALNKAVVSVLYQMLDNLYSMSHKAPLLETLYQEMKVNGLEMGMDSFKKSPKNSLVWAILHNNIVLVRAILNQFPELLFEKLQLPNHHIEHNSSQTNMYTLDMIIKHLKNEAATILEVCGEKWFDKITNLSLFEEVLDILELVPIKYRLNFAIAHCHEIQEIDNIIGILNRLQFGDASLKFAEKIQDRLENLEYFCEVLDKLPDDDARCKFATANHDKIKNSIGLVMVLKKLPPNDVRYKFAKINQSKINHSGGLVMVLKVLPNDRRYKFAIANRDMIKNGEHLSCVLHTLPEVKRLDFTRANQNKIQSARDLKWVLSSLPKNTTRYDFAVENEGLIKNIADLAELLPHLPTSDERYKFATRHQEKIQNADDLFSILSQLMGEPRDKFAKTHFDKIQNIKQLNWLLVRSSVKSKQEFNKLWNEKMENLSNSSDTQSNLVLNK